LDRSKYVGKLYRQMIEEEKLENKSEMSKHFASAVLTTGQKEEELKKQMAE